MNHLPGIHGGTTSVVRLKHDKTSQIGSISLVDSRRTGHSNDPSIWPALKNMSREVDTFFQEGPMRLQYNAGRS